MSTNPGNRYIVDLSPETERVLQALEDGKRSQIIPMEHPVHLNRQDREPSPDLDAQPASATSDEEEE